MAPAVHRYIIPASEEFATAECAARQNPVFQDVVECAVDYLVELRKPAAQENAEIETLGAILKLPAIYSESRTPVERLWQHIFVE